jgi:PAS domain S-box-containing protein
VNERLQTVARLSRLVAATFDVDQALTAIAQAVHESFDGAGVHFWTADEHARRLDQRLVLPSGLAEGLGRTTVAYGEGLAGHAAGERRVVHVADVTDDVRPVARDWFVARGFVSALLVPVVSDDVLLGVLSILGRAPFTDDDIALAEGLAAHAAGVLRNAAIFARSEARRQAAEALAEVGRLLSQTLDPETVGRRVTESVCRLLNARSAIIYRTAPDGSFLAETLSSAAEFPWLMRLPASVGIAGLAMRERQPVATSDLLADPRLVYTDEFKATVAQNPYRALLAVPLVAQGRELGCVAVGDRTGRHFSDDDMRLTQAFADQAAVALENARLYGEASRLVADEQAARASAQAAAQALRESEAVLQRAMEVGQIGSWTGAVTTEGPLDWSSEVFKIFGVDPADFRGVKEDFLDRVHPDDVPRLVAARDAALASGQPLRIDHRIVRPDGTVRWVHERADIQRDAQGRPVRFIGVVQDITERKQAEEALQAAEEQLRQSQKMDAIGRLAGGVAHDFNNLLSIITGRSELLLRRGQLAEGTRRDIDLIHRTAERAASLTRQLLAFSRKQVLQPKVLDLNAVVANMGRMLRRVIGEDIELVIVGRPGLGRVNADPGQLEQVILNLAVNARDAMPEGGRLTIETSDVELDADHARRHQGVRPGRHVMLAVTDTGTGMDAAVRERIFEPFFTTKEVGRGTGLGLSMVYGIVQQSGGTIWVYSEPGRGSTFKIYLPSVDESAQEPEAPVPPPRGGSETVLLCEDEAPLRELTREVLEEFGYRVLEAGDGKEALELVAGYRERIDLLLTDVVMPRMNGSELAARLAQERNLRVLYMSGYTEASMVRGTVPGAGFLQKPFSPLVLARAVREALDAS